MVKLHLLLLIKEELYKYESFIYKLSINKSELVQFIRVPLLKKELLFNVILDKFMFEYALNLNKL